MRNFQDIVFIWIRTYGEILHFEICINVPLNPSHDYFNGVQGPRACPYTEKRFKNQNLLILLITVLITKPLVLSYIRHNLSQIWKVYQTKFIPKAIQDVDFNSTTLIQLRLFVFLKEVIKSVSSPMPKPIGFSVPLNF